MRSETISSREDVGVVEINDGERVNYANTTKKNRVAHREPTIIPSFFSKSPNFIQTNPRSRSEINGE